MSAPDRGPQPVPPRVLRITRWLAPENRSKRADPIAGTWIVGEITEHLIRVSLRSYDIGLRYLAGQKRLPLVLHLHSMTVNCAGLGGLYDCLLLEAVEPGQDQELYRWWFGEEASR